MTHTTTRALESLRIQQESDGLYLVCDRGRVAQLLAGYGPTQQDDARFLRAAPALYAALKECEEYCDGLFPTLGKKCRAALAQADGKEGPP